MLRATIWDLELTVEWKKVRIWRCQDKPRPGKSAYNANMNENFRVNILVIFKSEEFSVFYLIIVF